MKRNWSSYLCITKSRCRVSDKWLGLRFLMSDEDRKVFVIAGYIHFLTCFSLTWHLSALTLPFLFPFPLYFFLTDTWLQFTHCYLFALTPLACTFYFSCTYLFPAPIVCILCKEEVVLSICLEYHNAENFTFHSILDE